MTCIDTQGWNEKDKRVLRKIIVRLAEQLKRVKIDDRSSNAWSEEISRLEWNARALHRAYKFCAKIIGISAVLFFAVTIGLHLFKAKQSATSILTISAQQIFLLLIGLSACGWLIMTVIGIRRDAEKLQCEAEKMKSVYS